MNITYSIGGETRTVSLDEFEDELLVCANQTVDDCEQEINEGGYWSDDDEGDRARSDARDELFDSLIGQARKCYRDGSGVIDIDPWYAKAQRCTCRIRVMRVEAESK